MMNVRNEDLIAAGVLTPEEIAYYENSRIPYGEPWGEILSIQGKVKAAIDAGAVHPVQEIAHNRAGFQVISDQLGEGVQGVFNPADGKKYDSKSSYYRAVKEAGCFVMGNDAPTEGKKELTGDFDCSKELKEALQQHLR